LTRAGACYFSLVSRDPHLPGGESPERFLLFVEGARDRGILEGWSQRLFPSLTRKLAHASVILGGRQPARAVEHFRRVSGAGAGARGLCLLDRDDGSAPGPAETGAPGLEFFTWSRRHIESYLLVPAAIRRALRLPDADLRVARVLRDHLPASGDESAFRALDAKRLLGSNGVLPRALGCSIPLGQVARSMRAEELHADVHALFGRLSGELSNGNGSRMPR
jgi:hypothetical protein